MLKEPVAVPQRAVMFYPIFVKADQSDTLKERRMIPIPQSTY